MPKLPSNWQAFALASAFFAGLTVIFGKLGVARLNANMATFIRTLVILAVVGLILTVRGQWRWPAQLPAWDGAFLVLSGIATGLSWLCYYHALQLGPASRVAPVDKLSVAFAILLAAVFLGETLTWQAALGGTLVVAGAVIMML
jgi:transporter family protein